MDQQKQELVEKLKGANNVLVTVSSNPSVDQLAACIGLTIFLNKLGKHATAVFSGAVPSTIDFLKPEETLEKNTDSLRDFIIALDKSKADKLRYKVEQNVVKIFITPYKTSINQDDLDFSQGDFNVDVVLCLGVQQQQELDQAITAHGRILHDAVVASINTANVTDLASINWVNTGASSLSQMAVDVVNLLGKDLMDGQIATALLTGIVAETARFSNEKTSPETMRLSAELMAAGANQQLVASELQATKVEAFTEVENQGESLSPGTPTNQDGMLEIDHPTDGVEPQTLLQPTAEPPMNDASEPADVDSPTDMAEPEPATQPASRLMLQPPSLGGTLTANTTPEGYDASVDPLTLLTADSGRPQTDASILTHAQTQSDDSPLLTTDGTSTPASDTAKPLVLEPSTEVGTDQSVPTEPEEPLVLPEVSAPQTDDTNLPAAADTPVEPLAIPPQQVSDTPSQDASSTDALAASQPDTPTQAAGDSPQTLSEIEQAVKDDHPQGDAPPAEGIDEARSAVLDAINSMPATNLEPQAASGATGYLDVQNLPDSAGPPAPVASAPTDVTVPAPPVEPPALLDEPPATTAAQPTLPLPPSLTVPPADPTPPTSTKEEPGAPPPVPPPITTDPTQFLDQSKAA